MDRAEVSALPVLLTREQAARVAGVSDMTMWRMCKSGKVKAVKVGAQWRINRDALLEQVGLGAA